jgi:hypothetical protein
MRSNKIEKEIVQLEEKLKQKITELGVTKASEMTDEQAPTLSQYIHGDRKFSYKKVIEISRKIGI